MYRVEFATIEDLIGNLVQFENEDVVVGEKLYVNKDRILNVDSVLTNDTGVVITSGEEFIKLLKI